MNFENFRSSELEAIEIVTSKAQMVSITSFGSRRVCLSRPGEKTS